MERRRAGDVLATLGILVALASVAFSLRLPEVEVEREGGLEPRWHVARGPAIGRYDAENDTTYVVFACSHWWCSVAVKVDGDVTDRLDGTSFLLRPLDDPPPSLARFAPPVAMPEPYAPVENATVGRFALHSTIVPTVASTGGLAFAFVGAAVAGRLRWDLVAGAAAGLGVAHGFLAEIGAFALIPVALLALPAMALGGILTVVLPRTRIGLVVIVLALTAALQVFLLAPLYPVGPDV